MSGIISVTKIFEFAAAHSLPYHEGLCKNFHGHNYKLEITISAKVGHGIPGTIRKETGMLIDFSRLKHIVNTHLLVDWDHSTLNTFFENPTAEMMVCYIADKLCPIIKAETQGACSLRKIRLWETSTSYATWEA